MSLTNLALLFLAGLAGGFIDSIAGGGGLITLPALLACGLPAQMALGTNKFQSSCGTSIAVFRYARAGLMRTPGLWLAVVCSFFASAFGSHLVTFVSNDVLKKIIPWMLAAVAIYTALHPRFGLHQGRARIAPVLFALFFGCMLGFYDGFFGPGAGSFWTVAGVALLGLGLRDA
ncbi:MAG: TSUP family transporter, partial [Verrucomicrobiaceae bacterium]